MHRICSQGIISLSILPGEQIKETAAVIYIYYQLEYENLAQAIPLGL